MTETPPLPTRTPGNQAMATTLQIWHNRNRALMERIAAGLRALDYPACCRSEEPLRGYAHAHQVMAAHARHRCPRYDLASRYTEQARP
ncbi:hypothetical protein ACFWPH_27555 [Nocardia sp. NPDC058499]|uniref:hypothetical protein n=1 Tax=Nocardia sp. NPDC058499 TaxID=3346530 RepID=UPI0036579B72